jgi:hypothetical protein
MRILASLLCIVLSVTAPRAGLCQAERPLSALPPKTEIKVQLLDSTTVVGRLRALEQRRLLLRAVVRPSATRAYFDDRTVPLDSVAGAWVRSGTRWKRGGVIGAAMGAAAMLIYLRIDLDMQDGSHCHVGCWIAAPLFGASFGAPVGFLVGHQFTVWKPLSF